MTDKDFTFDLVTVNSQGQVVQRDRGQNKYFLEDLTNGMSLEMVSIPGGTFMMGSPEGEKGSQPQENPQHGDSEWL